ncbi:Cro/CI family transcriptional regulator [Escherichia coli]|uniref:Cro/CI family transcriptional regulator n=1 Tax=Escherichia coli TaxID=562 RepID=UPI001C225C95|nr:Cro/CI family transcriptional regulator [Escherichia coli]
MYKKDVIDHFGTQRAVAKALGISDAAVSQWKEVTRPLRAAMIVFLLMQEANNA